MKLRTRLGISFIIVLTVPVILSFCLIFGVGKIRGDENIKVTSDELRVSSELYLITVNSKKAYPEVRSWIAGNVDKADDLSSLNELNRKVKDHYSFIIVRKDNDILYYGGGKDKMDFPLPQFGGVTTGQRTLYYNADKEPNMLRQIDFDFPDGGDGSIFLVTSAKTVKTARMQMNLDIFLAILTVLVLTAIVLIIWNYQGIVPRIKKLGKEADKIKSGTLDEPIVPEGNDEITDLYVAFEEMRKRLLANSKEKMRNEEEQKQLISNIVHDLKTPITAIKGYAEGILDGVAQAPEKKEAYLQTIVNKSNDMNALINELSLYTRIDTNRIPYNFTMVDVNGYFMDCAEELGLDLKNQKIKFSYNTTVAPGVRMIADPQQLERVIHNIVSNSVKYMGVKDDAHPGEISMEVKDVGDSIQVSIRDNGMGISEKDLPHIFERLYRADSSRNSSTGGSGIGLSIVKKIIEDHGGSIWTTSTLGQGTTMYFMLRKKMEERHGENTDSRR